jgi:hypothetical protein
LTDIDKPVIKFNLNRKLVIWKVIIIAHNRHATPS